MYEPYSLYYLPNWNPKDCQRLRPRPHLVFTRGDPIAITSDLKLRWVSTKYWPTRIPQRLILCTLTNTESTLTLVLLANQSTHLDIGDFDETSAPCCLVSMSRPLSGLLLVGIWHALLSLRSSSWGLDSQLLTSSVLKDLARVALYLK